MGTEGLIESGMELQDASGGSGGAQVVEFLLGDERYAMNVSRVGSIVDAKKITRLPRAPDSVRGIMDLRGETTAVIDPRRLLDLPDADQDIESQILVLDMPDMKQKMGILVDEVLDVEYVDPEDIDGIDEVKDLKTKGVEKRIAKGIIRKGSGDDVDLVIWVDVRALIEEGDR